MKKNLLITLALFTIITRAQTLMTDNFSTYNVGNVGTVITGATAGQGGYLTFNAAGGTNFANSNYQIITSANPTYGQAFQLTGSDAASGTRFMWKDGLDALWAARTASNDIIEVEFDYFTGPASTSRNDFRIVIYSDEATPKIIAGIVFNKNATISTVNYVNVVRGIAYFNNAGTPGLFNFGLGSGTTPQIAFADNTWVKVGFSFNKTTGDVTWKGPGFNGYVTGAALGLDPGEIDFISGAGASNTVAAVGLFDNFIARASSTDTLLGLNDSTVATKFSISPNPTSDFVNISSADNTGVNGISISDINGRIVKEISYQNALNVQVNLSDLSAGMYIMSIKSDQGMITKKVLKN